MMGVGRYERNGERQRSCVEISKWIFRCLVWELGESGPATPATNATPRKRQDLLLVTTEQVRMFERLQ